MLINKLLSLSNLYSKNGRVNPNLRKMLLDTELAYIRSLYPGIALAPSVYCLLNGIGTPICEQCNNTVTYFNPTTKQFSEHCSIACSRKGTKSKIKRRNTKLKKYEDENYNNRAQAKQTCLEKYGVTSKAKLPEVKTQISNTLVDTYLKHHDSIISKKEQTFLLKYGTHPNCTSRIKEKIKSNTIEKYGVEYTAQLETTKVKSKQTSLEKYGTEYYQSSSAAKKQNRCRYQQQKHKIKEDFIRLISNIPTDSMTRNELAIELGIPYSTLVVKIREYNIPIKYEIQSTISSGEAGITNYIAKTYFTDIKISDRTIIYPKELDILLPEYSLAIEYNGIYWHRPERFGSKEAWYDYHWGKIHECKKKGIRLLHLWENYGNHFQIIDDAILGIIDNNLPLVLSEIFDK